MVTSLARIFFDILLGYLSCIHHDDISRTGIYCIASSTQTCVLLTSGSLPAVTVACVITKSLTVSIRGDLSLTQSIMTEEDVRAAVLVTTAFPGLWGTLVVVVCVVVAQPVDVIKVGPGIHAGIRLMQGATNVQPGTPGGSRVLCFYWTLLLFFSEFLPDAVYEGMVHEEYRIAGCTWSVAHLSSNKHVYWAMSTFKGAVNATYLRSNIPCISDWLNM